MSTTFEEALKATLISVNEDFEKADADLHLEGAAAAQSLAKVTEGAATMVLKKISEAESGVKYKLVVSGKQRQYEISQFFVPSRGYPIKISRSDTEGGIAVDIKGGVINVPPTRGEVVGECKDRLRLAEYFSELASNPDSTLVTAAAYIMRKK